MTESAGINGMGRRLIARKASLRDGRRDHFGLHLFCQRPPFSPIERICVAPQVFHPQRHLLAMLSTIGVAETFSSHASERLGQLFFLGGGGLTNPFQTATSVIRPETTLQ
jgi:hypothetical protein